MMRLFSFALSMVLLFTGFRGLSFAEEIRPTQWNQCIFKPGKWKHETLDSAISQIVKLPTLSQRMVLASSRFLDTPYAANTLVGSPTIPETLVVNLQSVDCFTFLDYLLAMCLSSHSHDFPDRLRKVRYKDGKIDYQHRNHFFTQWIERNPKAVHLFRTPKSSCTSKILNRRDKARFWLEEVPLDTQSVCCLSPKAVLTEPNLLQSGDLVGFCSSLEGLDVSHVGMVIQHENRLYLRHASSRHGKVLDEPLDDYLGRRKKVTGLLVARPRDAFSEEGEDDE